MQEKEEDVIKETEVREEESRDLTNLFTAVDDAIKKGITRLEIRQQLLDQGWTNEEIDKAFIKYDIERLSKLAALLEEQFALLKKEKKDIAEGRIHIKRKVKRKAKAIAVPRPVKKKVHKHYHHRIVASVLTKKFHHFDCKFSKLIDKKDKKTFKSDLEALVKGYIPCHACIHLKPRIVACKKTKRYHQPKCRFVKKIKQADKVMFLTEKDASSKKYQPCSKCNNVIVVYRKKKEPKVVHKHYHHRFVGSVDGGHFHTYNCHWGDSIELKKQRFFPSMASAMRHGYKACDRCIKGAKKAAKQPEKKVKGKKSP